MPLNFQQPPFRLDSAALDWVKATFDRLSADQRLAQLFVLRSGLDRAGFRADSALQTGRHHGRVRARSRR